MRARDLNFDFTEALERLSYDPKTGKICWTEMCAGKSFKTRLVGEIAGSVGKYGYRQIKIRGRYIKAHRLAWAFMTGAMPPGEVDHINGNRDDNRWENLRLATVLQNNWNTGIRKTNTSGFKGVSFWRKSKKWKAQIAVRGQKIFLGYHETPEAAYEAYVAAARLHHGEFARVA